MKMIDVYVLLNCNDPDFDKVEGLTASLQEAVDYQKQEGAYRYKIHKLTIPQEILVQCDY